MNHSRSSWQFDLGGASAEKSSDVIRVCTWNINEGEDIHANERTPSPESAIEELVNRASIDLLALQELPMEDIQKSRTLTHIANNSALRNIYAIDLSPSFSGTSPRAGLGIASTFPLIDPKFFSLPNPRLSLPRGQGLSFDKGVLAVTLEAFGVAWHVITVHSFPFHRFGAAPSDEAARPVWQAISHAIDSVSDGSRTLVLGDFNASDRKLIIARTNTLLYSAMNGVITHRDMAADDILLSSDVSLANKPFTIANFSDHLACLADLHIELP